MYYVVSASSFACRFFNINIAWDLRKDTDDFSDIQRQHLLRDRPGDAEYLEAFDKVASLDQLVHMHNLYLHD